MADVLIWVLVPVLVCSLIIVLLIICWCRKKNSNRDNDQQVGTFFRMQDPSPETKHNNQAFGDSTPDRDFANRNNEMALRLDDVDCEVHPVYK